MESVAGAALWTTQDARASDIHGSSAGLEGGGLFGGVVVAVVDLGDVVDLVVQDFLDMQAGYAGGGHEASDGCDEGHATQGATLRALAIGSLA